MRTLTKKAISLAALISRQYNMLELDKYKFFETYHDSMRCQMECAWEEVDNVAAYEEDNDEDSALSSISLLQQTLTYCKAVIRLQKLTKALPEAIYG